MCLNNIIGIPESLEYNVISTDICRFEAIYFFCWAPPYWCCRNESSFLIGYLEVGQPIEFIVFTTIGLAWRTICGLLDISTMLSKWSKFGVLPQKRAGNYISVFFILHYMFRPFKTCQNTREGIDILAFYCQFRLKSSHF